MKGKIALVDADLIAHRSSAIAEPVRYLAEFSNSYQKFDSSKDMKTATKESPPVRVWTYKEDKGEDFALMIAKQTFDTIIHKVEPSAMMVFLSGRYNFRYQVATTVPYKWARETMGKPKYFRAVKEWIKSEYGASVSDGIEADDAISITATGLGKAGFIISLDKDLHQVDGWHYNWVTDTVSRVSKKEACYNLFRQVIVGDATDGVPGLPGHGPKAAEKCLDGGADAKDLFARVWGLYRTGADFLADVSRRWDYFEEQTRLVYLLRHEGDTFKNVPGYQEYSTFEKPYGEAPKTAMVLAK